MKGTLEMIKSKHLAVKIGSQGAIKKRTSQHDSSGLLKLEYGTLKACGHSHLWVHELLGRAPVSEPGHLFSRNQPRWKASQASSGPSCSSLAAFSGIMGEYRWSLYPCIRPQGSGGGVGDQSHLLVPLTERGREPE